MAGAKAAALEAGVPSFDPTNLESVRRHNVSRQRMDREKEQEEKKQREKALFKALPMPGSILYGPGATGGGAASETKAKDTIPTIMRASTAPIYGISTSVYEREKSINIDNKTHLAHFSYPGQQGRYEGNLEASFPYATVKLVSCSCSCSCPCTVTEWPLQWWWWWRQSAVAGRQQ